MSAAQRFAEISAAAGEKGARAGLGRAVVLGGSVAVLMAARALSDHAAEVVIVERDDLRALDVPDARLAADPVGAVAPRPGVPQGAHVHALLPSGQAQLERWFPGFEAAARAAGAPEQPPGTGRFIMDGHAGAEPSESLGVKALASSRPFLEALIRHRVLALPNVRTLQGRADGLAIAGGKVIGVRYVPAGAETAEDLTADFVVDATGRSSRLGDWIEGYGFPRPPMQRMNIQLNYATAKFHRPAGATVWSCISITTPGDGRTPRIGGFTPIEGDRWTMLVSGYADDKPTRDRDDYVRRCKEHFPPEFGEVATTAPWAGEVATYHQADSRRRDFDELDRFPARLVVAGDAVASFNPVYGQGMTSAMLHASCLALHLRGNPDLDLPARGYFTDVRVVVDAAWQTSTVADLGLPHVDGPYPPGYRLLRRVSGLIFGAAGRDAVVGRQIARVTTMLAHPGSLATPGILVRALRASLKR